jgi:hypothetical protein
MNSSPRDVRIAASHRGNDQHRIGRRDYRDIAKSREREQIAIARDDEFGITRQRAGQHMIVIGIVENGRRDRYGRYEFGKLGIT